MKLPYSIALLAMSLSFTSPSAWPDSVARSSEASTRLSRASGTIVAGSADVLAAGGELIVVGVESLADGVVLVFRRAAEAGTVSIELSREAAGSAWAALGAALTVVAESTGYALLAAGELVAFVPNRLGTSLLHHSRPDGR